jgi:hypothetical protein
MKLLRGFAAGLLVGLFIAAAALAIETKHDKDVAECKIAGESAGNEAVKKVTVKHPLDVVKIKADAKLEKFNACMAGKGYAAGKIRAK